MNRLKALAASTLLASLAVTPVYAANPTASTTSPKQAVKHAQDAEWITLSGTVKSAGLDTFELNYGKGQITVEMDDYDWYTENALVPGDKVTVSGRMDKGFYETRKIEASSVYVKKLNEYFFASSVDEEGDYRPYVTFNYLDDDENVSVTGRVTKIDDNHLTLDTGGQTYRVDASDLGYNPFDDDGIEKIEVGERVSVYGEMDDADLFDQREIEANTIITLSPASVTG